MKNISKIALSLSVVTGLLAISQVSIAAVEITSKEEKIVFSPNSSQPANCKTPAPFSFTYTHDHSRDLRTIVPAADAGIKSAVVEDSKKIGNTVYYVNTFIYSADMKHPLYIHGYSDVDKKGIDRGVYWRYMENGKRCSGTFKITAQKKQAVSEARASNTGRTRASYISAL